jgi:hypothetical protein
MSAIRVVPPNMRVQRTRFASLRSPLTRRPLGRVGIAGVLMTIGVHLAAAPGDVSLSVTPSDSQATVVVIEARNTSKHPVSMNLIPSVELGEGEATYWAPFRFAGPDHRLEANSRSNLSLPAGGVIHLALDLAALSWAEKRSSVWPNRPMKTVVPAGSYSLVVIGAGDGSERLVSKPARWVAP